MKVTLVYLNLWFLLVIDGYTATVVIGPHTADTLTKNAQCFPLHHIHTCLIQPDLAFVCNHSY